MKEVTIRKQVLEKGDRCEVMHNFQFRPYAGYSGVVVGIVDEIPAEGINLRLQNLQTKDLIIQLDSGQFIVQPRSYLKYIGDKE